MSNDEGSISMLSRRRLGFLLAALTLVGLSGCGGPFDVDAPDATAEQLADLQEELASLPHVTEVEIDYNPARIGSGRSMRVNVTTAGLDEAAIRDFYPSVLEQIAQVPFEFGGARSGIWDEQTDDSLTLGDFEPELGPSNTRERITSFLNSR